MMPASNMKILTTATAAAVLGWDYRFTTVLETAAPIEDGTLKGDLFIHGSGDPTSHPYAAGGTKTITLTVKLASNGKKVGSSTRSLTLANPDLAPTAAATCTWDANTWQMTVVDASSDDGADADAVPPDGNATRRSA